MSEKLGAPDLRPGLTLLDPCVVRPYRAWVHRMLASDLLSTRHRCIEYAMPREVA